jgi:hypothetical protein
VRATGGNAVDNGGVARGINVVGDDWSSWSMYGLVRMGSSSGPKRLLGSKCSETEGDKSAPPVSRSLSRLVTRGRETSCIIPRDWVDAHGLEGW